MVPAWMHPCVVPNRGLDRGSQQISVHLVLNCTGQQEIVKYISFKKSNCMFGYGQHIPTSHLAVLQLYCMDLKWIAR